jgi:hypothetical protein
MMDSYNNFLIMTVPPGFPAMSTFELPRSPSLSRRGFLRLGGATLGGLTLADLFRLREARAAQEAQQETAVILLWLPGGPPHMEMYDLKPDAPSEYRGEFKPIPTTVAGLDVCEHLPLHAKTAHQYNIIRSVAHEFADHGGGHKRFLTGRKPAEPTGFVNDAPMVGSIVAKARERLDMGLPNYVAGTDPGRSGVDVFSFGAAYLGEAYTPFLFGGDPGAADFKVEGLDLAPEVAARLGTRARLLDQFDGLQRSFDKSSAVDAMDEFDRRALGILLSPKARRAFDLTREDPKLRDRYGRHPYGQRALLARRLVEAGCSFVTMVLETPIPPGGTYPTGVIYNWDSHAVNGHIFDDARYRFPFYDQAVTALVGDLYDRGLDRRVLLIVTGEFGRTPRITYDKGRPGRDHWPDAMSMLVAGGGMRTGQVIGSTDRRGERPHDRPLTPNDLWATMYRHLGIDFEASIPDLTGRPMPILPFGDVIEELLPV